MKPKIAVIGGGTAGLSFSSFVDTTKFDVTLFEKKNRLGSKLLVAGKGGFNLTHSEPLPQLIARYQPISFLEDAITNFTNSNFRSFLKQLNIETFIGSSGRIFPIKSIKPIAVLNAIENKIIKNQVKIIRNAKWQTLELNDGLKSLTFDLNGNSHTEIFDYVIFALGGKSWSITGSDGDWFNQFKNLSVQTVPFESSNSAMKVSWPKSILDSVVGKPLKNLSVSANQEVVKGELMVTNFGLEGTPIYTLNKHIRTNNNQDIKSFIHIDFKPNLSHQELLSKIKTPISKSWTNHLETSLNLTKVQMTLLKAYTTKETFLSPDLIIAKIKKFSLEIEGLAPIDEAISTVGGIDTKAVTKYFELQSIPKTFVLGEMLDWDAPTGGYLIQGCMSMGHYLAKYFNQAM